jgi:hypothetical protein
MDGVEMPPMDMDGEMFDVQKFLHAVQNGLGLPQHDLLDEEMLEQQEMMDEELKEYGMDQEFEKQEDGDVDIDLNLVKSIMDGFEASNGQSGAMNNLLGLLNKSGETK